MEVKYHCQVLTSVIVVVIIIIIMGNGVIVHSVFFTCDAALFAECFPIFLRNVGKPSIQ